MKGRRPIVRVNCAPSKKIKLGEHDINNCAEINNPECQENCRVQHEYRDAYTQTEKKEVKDASMQWNELLVKCSLLNLKMSLCMSSICHMNDIYQNKS